MEKIRLGDIATYINGYAFKPDDWGDEGRPIIRIQDLTGNGYQTNRFAGSIPEKYNVIRGDVLISWSASLGVYVWNGEEAVLNQHIFKVVFDKKTINKVFFIHQVSGVLKKAVSEAHGATMKHLTKPVFDALPFVLPDIEEQNRIAEILDKAQSVIKARQQQLSDFDTLIKARFVEMFGDLMINPKGWELFDFDELTDLITDGEHNTPKRTEKGIYLLSARNILNHDIQLNDVDFIDEEEYKRIAKRVVPQTGDVLISCSGSVGRCCSVPKGLKFQMVRSAAILRFKDVIRPIFAEYMITSDYVQRQIDSSKTASSQANLFQGKIAKLKGFVPPVELQIEFEKFVTQVDKSKVAVQSSLAEAQTLFDSLMQKYFG